MTEETYGNYRKVIQIDFQFTQSSVGSLKLKGPHLVVDYIYLEINWLCLKSHLMSLLLDIKMKPNKCVIKLKGDQLRQSGSQGDIRVVINIQY